MSGRHDEPKTPQAGEAGTAARSGVAQAGPNVQADRPPMSADTAALLGLIDRLGSLLERSELVELEVEAGETGILLRKTSALLPTAATLAVTPVAAGDPPAGAAGNADPVETPPAAAARSVKAPLTGIFYGASSPTSPPFVSVGQHITVGQVIGLIEAMKLFNEIKSDQAGRVVRIVAESGKLVKAKQPLIEVEP